MATLLCVVLSAIPASAIVKQESKTSEVVSFGHEKMEHPMNNAGKPMVIPKKGTAIVDLTQYHKAAQMYFDDVLNNREVGVSAVHTDPQAPKHAKAAVLLQQHSLSIAGSKASKGREDEGPTVVNFGLHQMSPFKMILLVAAIAAAMAFLVYFTLRQQDKDYHKYLGERSGLSTSSSDITSSETGSTDRELKSRMERFERRLEEHKRMLEDNDTAPGAEPTMPSSGSPSTGTPPNNGGDIAASTGVKLTWMHKQ